MRVIGRLGDYRTLYGRAMETTMDTPDAWTYAVFPRNYGIGESIIDDEVHDAESGRMTWTSQSRFASRAVT